MKESIGNAFVYGVFIMFFLLAILLLSSSISYSRANKIKNKLVNSVQSYASSLTTEPNQSMFNTPEFIEPVDEYLRTVGYRRATDLNHSGCNNTDGGLKMDLGSMYDYCIIGYQTNRGYYYKIVAYMYFDVPIIGSTLKFPISGSTKVIYNLGDK